MKRKKIIVVNDWCCVLLVVHVFTSHDNAANRMGHIEHRNIENPNSK